MNDAHYQRISGLFKEACELPAEERGAFLDRACGDDAALREEVESLLRHDRPDDGVLADANLAHELHAISEDADRNMHPKNIGPYRIVRMIATGGMGAVYEAEQENPKRKVAVKVVRFSAAAPDARRRFRFEAQLLARLQHPGIAQVFEAGTYDDGHGAQPYFAMEYIDGRPLTEYAKARGLDPRARLELLASICDAVHHAHQKGIIHRDLKPGNILITPGGMPKVLDFGVARVVSGATYAETMHTASGQIIGTAPYMSPEQVSGRNELVDTRSDVYALGVIGYELLSGRLPFDPEGRTLSEIIHQIENAEPASLGVFNRAYRGDIETIFAKALEKDPDRRYQSAAELAADIRRSLNDESIAAHPPSRIYQLRKFARRNKQLVAGAGAVIVVLTAGVIGTTIGMLRAIDARDVARENEEIAAFELEKVRHLSAITKGIFESITPEIAQGRDTELLAVALNRAVRQIDEESVDNPEVHAHVRDYLGAAFLKLGMYDKAVAQFERGLEITRAAWGADNPSAILFRARLGAVLCRSGRMESGIPMLRDALERARRVHGPDARRTLVTCGDLGRALRDIGQFDEAERFLREAFDGLHARFGDHSEDTLTAASDLGLLLMELGRYDEAQTHLQLALDGRREILGRDHLVTLRSAGNMGVLIDHRFGAERAEPYSLEVLNGYRRLLGPDHPDTLTAASHHAMRLRKLGRLDEAEELLDDTLARRRRVSGERHSATLNLIDQLAQLVLARDRLEDAEPLFREALDGRRAILGERHPMTLSSFNNVGYVLKELGRPDEAEAFYLEALEGRRAVFGEGHPRALITQENLAYLYRTTGRLDEALSLYKDAAERWAGGFGHGHPKATTMRLACARTLREMKRFEEAETELAALQEMIKEGAARDEELEIHVLRSMMYLYEAWHLAEPDAGHAEKAESARAALSELENTTGVSSAQ